MQDVHNNGESGEGLPGGVGEGVYENSLYLLLNYL